MSDRAVTPESRLIGLCSRAVPAETALRARLHLLDWLGCIIAAREAPAATALARALDMSGEDLLRGALASTGADTQRLALAFGALGNVLEMDDLHRGALLHAGDTVCAAALAWGLNRGCSGAALLAAIVRGYEAGIRIGQAAAAGGYTPFYNSGTCGVFGAAMACADLARLSPAATADALGQAGMQASGVWQCRLEPTFSKQLACAHAARAGVFSAELAAAGFPGARQILTGDMGFFASYYPAADRGFLTAESGEGWAIEQTSFKPFAACRHTHPAISAALALRGEFAADDICSIEVQTYRAAIDFCDAEAPPTPDAARFSLQHAVGVALSRGAPSIADFEEYALADADIARLRACTRLAVDPGIDAGFPAAFGARVIVLTTAGDRHEAACPAAWGDPENPMSEADILAKFNANASHGRIRANAALALADAVMALPDAPDLSRLSETLQTAFTPDQETA